MKSICSIWISNKEKSLVNNLTGKDGNGQLVASQTTLDLSSEPTTYLNNRCNYY